MEESARMRPTLGDPMNREESLRYLESHPKIWDVIIIGGGASGLGAAVDAASRGLRTLLLEQSDFAKGTSSRSTKLIHGGLRYLQQGNISLVTEALKERGRLCSNAPHLIHHLPFLVPQYRWWEGPFYGIGLKIYDTLAGTLGIEPSKLLTRRETLRSILTLKKEGLRGGVCYYDGQFDDARLAIALARTATTHGACLLNYMKVTSFLKKNGIITGVRFTDIETGKHHYVEGKSVINATGIFSDHLRKVDNKKEKPILVPSQGIHLVLPKSFMPSKSAILVPHTDDGRVIFLVPWHGRVLLGTTDTAVRKPLLEPHAQKKEIKFLLKHAARYLSKTPTEEDILSVFCGMRPLVKAAHAKKTAAISRDHTILISPSGLITVTGGKWTTYRKMAQDVIDKAILVGSLPERACRTETLRLHGYQEKVDPRAHFSTYGTEAKIIRALMRTSALRRKKIHPKLPYYVAEVIFAVRYEMARSVEDILARRTRSLLLNARASLEAAPLVAKILARELDKKPSWIKTQIKEYEDVAKHYLP